MEYTYPLEFKSDIFISAQKLNELVEFVMAESDTDDYVFSYDTLFGCLDFERPAVLKMINGSLLTVSPGAVYTGDSDFLSRYPFCTGNSVDDIGICIVDYEHVR